MIAEPNALVGFAGPRVIEQTVRQTLPEGFQKAEFLLEKGAIDMIVDRRNLRGKIGKILFFLQKGKEAAQINSIEDLNGKKIGILTGSVAYQTIQKYIKDAYIVFQCRC
mgnify:CR=1 FL=1